MSEAQLLGKVCACYAVRQHCNARLLRLASLAMADDWLGLSAMLMNVNN
jgi:hypothetical protein